MSLNEAMERAALAWLADRVTEVGQTVSQRHAAKIAIYEQTGWPRCPSMTVTDRMRRKLMTVIR